MAFDDDAEEGQAPSMSLSDRAPPVINNVMTIMLQNQKHPNFRGILDMSSLHYQSNLGQITEALLQGAGFDWSATGKSMWRKADPSAKLAWREPKASNTRAPKEARQTTLGGLVATQHDREACVVREACDMKKCGTGLVLKKSLLACGW